MTRSARRRKLAARSRARRVSGLAVVLALVFGLTASAFAADWSNSRGDAANTGSSSESLALPLTERWHSSAPAVEENGAVAANGIVYMASDDGNLYAFDATGAPISGFPATIGSTNGAPAVDAANGKVYVLTSSGLEAFNLNGTSAWTKDVGGTGANYNVGPTVEAGFVYLKGGDGTLRKFNSAGTLQWSVPSAGRNTQPTIMGGFVYVNSEGGQIRKYDKSTGAEVATGGFPITAPIDQAGLSAASGRIFYKADRLYAYDASTGALAWSAADGGDSTFYDSPAVSNGVVYVYGWDSKAYAFDAATGAPKSGFPSAALSVDGDRNYSSPAVAGGLVFIGAGTSQKLKVLAAAGTANAGTVLEEHLTFSDDTQGFDLASPIVSNGVVYAMLDGGGLYAFFAAGTAWTGGAVSINGGAACTTSQAVTLTLDAGSNPNVNQMRISEDPLFTTATFEPFATSKAFNLSAGLGTKTVYVQFRDTSAQLSNVFNDSIDYAASCSRTLTVTKDGTGTGTVTSTPGGINCGTTCSNAFADGSSVTLSAVPTGTSTFSGWSGGGCSGTGTCQVTMNANTSVTATFASQPGNRTLSVFRLGTGSGTVTSSPAGINCGTTCSASFASGTQVTLTAAPAAGSTFSGWSGGGCTTGTCVVTLTANTGVHATFTIGGGLTVTPSVTPKTVTAGSLAKTHFTIRNTGANRAHGVAATVKLPSGATPISITPSAGGCSGFTNGKAVCLFGDISAGGNRAIDVVFRTPTGTTGPSLVLVDAVSDDAGSASGTGGPTLVASRPGYARGFVPPGGSITTGNDPTADNPLVNTFQLPNVGSGAAITLRLESAGADTFCGGNPCAGRKILFLSPFTGYDNKSHPAEWTIVWDKSIVGTSTSFPIYIQKVENGPIVTIPNCKKYGDESNPDVADPHPCVELRKRRSNDDVEAHILLISGDPRGSR